MVNINKYKDKDGTSSHLVQLDAADPLIIIHM